MSSSSSARRMLTSIATIFSLAVILAAAFTQTAHASTVLNTWLLGDKTHYECNADRTFNYDVTNDGVSDVIKIRANRSDTIDETLYTLSISINGKQQQVADDWGEDDPLGYNVKLVRASNGASAITVRHFYSFARDWTAVYSVSPSTGKLLKKAWDKDVSNCLVADVTNIKASGKYFLVQIEYPNKSLGNLCATFRYYKDGKTWRLSSIFSYALKYRAKGKTDLGTYALKTARSIQTYKTTSLKTKSISIPKGKTVYLKKACYKNGKLLVKVKYGKKSGWIVRNSEARRCFTNSVFYRYVSPEAE